MYRQPTEVFTLIAEDFGKDLDSPEATRAVLIAITPEHGKADFARTAMNSGKPIFLSASANIQQRAAFVLRDVSYVVEAHFEMTATAGEQDTPEKFCNMILRRLRSGQCFHQPYFGCREFPARFCLVEEGESFTPLDENRGFGLMPYDMDYTEPERIAPTFFRAVMRGGTIDLADCEVSM